MPELVIDAPRTLDQLTDLADLVVALETPQEFSHVGKWYDDFGQVCDNDVVSSLARLRDKPP